MLHRCAKRSRKVVTGQLQEHKRCYRLKLWDTPDKQKQFLEDLGKQLKVKSLDDWYSVGHAQFVENGAGGFLNTFQGSLQKALSSVYPEHKWIPWKFPGVSKRFWSNPVNQKAFLDWFMQQRNISSPEDWYKITRSDVHSAGGASLISTKFGDSLLKLAKALYPNHEWLEWKFDKAPRSFWASKANRRKFLEWVKVELNIESQRAWYSVSPHQLVELGGSAMVENYYNRSMINMMEDLYPDQEWHEWLWPQPRANFWASLKNQKRYLDWVMKERGMKDLADWYSVADLAFDGQRGRRFVLNQYGGSLPEALKAVYSTHNWEQERFSVAMITKSTTARATLTLLAQSLGVKRPEDWYTISKTQIMKLQPLFLEDNGGTLYNALKSLQPEHKWLPWKFRRVEDGFWDDRANVSEYMAWASVQLNIQSLSDWYSIPVRDFYNVGGSFLLSKYKIHPLFSLLKQTYPNHEWRPWLFHHLTSSVWEDKTIQRDYIAYLANKLGFHSNDDLYNLTEKHFYLNKGRALLKIYDHSIPTLLKEVVPEYDWQSDRFRHSLS